MPRVRDIRKHINDDPRSRSYATMSDSELLTDLTVTNVAEPTGIVDAYRVVNSVTATDWSTASEAQKDAVRFIVSAGRVDMDDANVRAILAAAFGQGTDTRNALVALQANSKTIAEIYGLGDLALEHVVEARS